MKYRKKSRIIEAVKWDRNIETIKNNAWLEEAIKEDRVILGMNDVYDKEPELLIQDDYSKEFIKIEEGDYVIKETHNQNYIIRVMGADEFENIFEAIQEDKTIINNSFVVDLELNTKEFKEELKAIEGNVKDTLSLIDKLIDKNNFKVVTKDMYIASNIGVMSMEDIEHTWQKVSKGYNFALYKETDNIYSGYYSVDKVNELFRR